MKKLFILTITTFILLPFTVIASSNTQAKIGNNYFDNLEDAITSANSTDVITIMSNVKLEKELNINKEINIDLKGNNIEAPTNSFLVQGGKLNITGPGTISETNPNYGAIKVFGDVTDTNKEYSVVNIGKDVTLEGWAGIFVSQTDGKSYGVKVDFDGNIKAISDTSGGKGIGIYVNGKITDESSSPIINIKENANITSNGNGLYIGGYTTLNIKGGYIEGDHAGIAIKSGILKIDGGTIECNGEDTTPTEGYNNGVNASGTAIQIESNPGYAGNMEITINNGNIRSKNSNVLYEYIGKGSTTQVKAISLNGGTFKSLADKNVFLLSNSFKSTHPKFISGGAYSSNPTEYLLSGFTSTQNDGLYSVDKSTSKTVFGELSNENNNYIPTILICTLIIITLVILYIKKDKLIKIIKKI